MTPSPAAAISLFARRTALAAFGVAAARALLATAAASAALLLAVRLAGGHAAPGWHWVWLAAPVVGYALFVARRQRLPRAVAAGHLDRRLGLDGLLMAADEGIELDADFRQRLLRGLAGLPAALPAPDWRRVLPLPVVVVGLATAVAMLPAPQAPPAPPARPAATAQLDQLAVAMRELFLRGDLPAEVKQELEQRFATLQRDAEAGRAPEWRDLDELEQRIVREAQLQRLAELAGAAGSVRPGARRPGTPNVPSARQLAAIAKALAASGALDELAPAVRELLQNAKLPDGTFDPALLALDPATMQQVMAAMADLAARLGPLAESMDPATLRELARLAEAFGAGQGGGAGEGEGAGASEGEGGQRPGGGRGGVDRGPGHAALQLTENALGGADQALRLPPGAPLPGDWVPVDSTTRPAEAAPVPNTGAGGEAVTGSAGATWQLQLAPRHRAVVRRYFDAGDGEGRKERR